MQDWAPDPVEALTVSPFQTHRERNQEQRARLSRQVDGVCAEDKQMALERILVTLLQKH